MLTLISAQLTAWAVLAELLGKHPLVFPSSDICLIRSAHGISCVLLGADISDGR